jgi:hypothetical protein
VPHALTLAAGLILGWALAAGRPQALRAHGGDRFDDSVLASGPVYVRYNKGTLVQVAQDALYYLDYRAGKLYGTVPSVRQTVGGSNSKLIEGFAERDLVTDFHLDAESGARPHFLMTTGSMANGGGGYVEGWAPLFVFESTTRQVAVYKIQPQSLGTASVPRLDLVELRPFGPSATATVPAPR